MKIITVITASLLLSASYVCAGGLSQTHHVQASKAQVTKPYYKPGAPVAITTPSEYSMSPGASLTVELAVKIAGRGKTLLQLVPSDGLKLHSDNRFSFAAAGEQVFTVEVSTDRYDLAHLRIFAQFEDAKGLVTSRAMAVAFDSRTAAQMSKVRSAQAKDVIVMPATETIR